MCSWNHDAHMKENPNIVRRFPWAKHKLPHFSAESFPRMRTWVHHVCYPGKLDDDDLGLLFWE